MNERKNRSEEYFENVLSEISDEKIEKAAFYRSKSRLVTFRRLAVAAACLVVVVAGTAIALNRGGIFLGGERGDPFASTTAKEDLPATQSPVLTSPAETREGTTAFEEDEKNKTFEEKYEYLELDGEFEFSGKFVPSKNSLVFLKISVCFGFFGEKRRETEVEVFEIANCSKNFAVAVRPKGEKSYYLFSNSSYSPATLGVFVDELSLEKALESAGPLGVVEKRFGKEYCYYSDDEKRQSQLEEMLRELFEKNKALSPVTPHVFLEETESKNTEKNGEEMRFSVLLGETGLFAVVEIYSDGYVFIDLGANNCVGFEFKKRDVRAFFKEVKKGAARAEATERLTTVPPDSQKMTGGATATATATAVNGVTK